MKQLSIDEIYIKTDKNDHSLKNYVKKMADKYYKDKKINEENYKLLGGTKENKEKNNIEIYKDTNFLYEKDIVCNSCKKKTNEKMTPNKPGIMCYISKNSKSKSLNIKVECKNCSSRKNSYINKKELPENILKKIETKLEKLNLQ